MNLPRLRRRAASGYWLESVTRAVAPACGILAAYLAVALLGFGDPWAFAGILVLGVLALGYGLSRLRRPNTGEIDRRIERASGLRHRPIAMLEDEPENDGPLASAIWQIHQRRIAASLQHARPGRPFIDAVARDPMALRSLLLLLLLASAIIAGPQAMPRIAGAFVLPEWPFSGPSVNAWLTPPSYTGDPPLVLQPGQTYAVLAGSGLTVVINGESHPPSTLLGSKSLMLAALAQNSFRTDLQLTATTRLRIGPWWHPLGRWTFNVSPPEGPVITMDKPNVVNRRLIIGWHAKDRYGLDALTAALTPVGHPQAAPEVLSLPLPELDPRDDDGVAQPDIADSPYAGLPVSLVLTARNLAGVEGSTAPMILTLPPLALSDKTALALAAVRQKLALTPKHTQAAGDALKKLSQLPLSKITASADVQMAMLAQALKANEIGASDAQSLLDTLAQEVESGPDYQPARALAIAVQALEQALQQAANGGKLDPGRLQNLLAAMQSALAQHLQALGTKTAGNPGSAPMNAGDLNRLAEQIAKDEAAGQTAKAQAELHQLEQMLSALQSAKPMTAADAARSAAANQAAQDLGQMTKAESALMDQTNQGTALPSMQAALRKQLSSTRQNLGQANIPLPGLGDAAAAMGAAQSALARQDETAAAGAEDSAIRGLQKAAAALSASSQGMSFDAGGQGAAAVDSFENGSSGAPDENPVPTILPSGGNAAGIIQQQIIKNDANPALPDATHQYYHRLLNQDAP